MAIVHDLAEAIVGDIAPSQNVSKEDKNRLESEAMALMVQTLDRSKEALDIQSLWLEYEDGTSAEALFVKDLDKFEMIMQAHEYEKSWIYLLLNFNLFNMNRR